MKVPHDFKQTMVEPNIWGVFWAITFEFDTEAEPYRLLFDEEKLRQNEGFRELWSIDFPWINYRVGGRKAERQNARFDWINKQKARIK
jgi:hypothetical protein